MVTTVVLVTVLLLAVSSSLVSGDENLHIFALPVGQGDATVIKCPDYYDVDGQPRLGKLTIIDIGSRSKKASFMNTEKKIMDFLGDHEIEKIYLTHPDTDHYNKLEHLASKLSKRVDLYHSCPANKYQWKTPNSNRLYTPLKGYVTKSNARGDVRHVRNRVNKVDCSSGDYDSAANTHTICEEGSNEALIQILASELTDDSCKISDLHNEASLVLQLKFQSKKVLFVGDLQGEALEIIIDDCNIKSDALRLSHHGAKQANPERFLEAVSPNIAFASSDPCHGGFHHPHCNIAHWFKPNGFDEHSYVCWLPQSSKKMEIKLEKGYTGGFYTTTTSPHDKIKNGIVHLTLSHDEEELKILKVERTKAIARSTVATLSKPLKASPNPRPAADAQKKEKGKEKVDQSIDTSMEKPITIKKSRFGRTQKDTTKYKPGDTDTLQYSRRSKAKKKG